MHFQSTVRPAPEIELRLGVGPGGLCRVSFRAEIPEDWPENPEHPVLKETERQLGLYFAGQLREFDLPLELRGSPFQKRVWETLRTIPYGHTMAYAELAAAVGSPRGFRAVGSANGRNPIPIIVPCHRVIQTGGGLGGFGGGVPLKRRLLELERGSAAHANENSCFELR